MALTNSDCELGWRATEYLNMCCDDLYTNDLTTGNTPESFTLFNRDARYICRSNISLFVLHNNDFDCRDFLKVTNSKNALDFLGFNKCWTVKDYETSIWDKKWFKREDVFNLARRAPSF